MSASTCTPSRLARSYAPGSRTGSATTTGSARIRPWRGVRPTRPTASRTRPDWRPDKPRDHLSYAAKLSGQTGPPHTDQGLVAPDRRLNQAAPSVPCHLAPPRAALLVNEVDVTVSLAWGRVSLSTEN